MLQIISRKAGLAHHGRCLGKHGCSSADSRLHEMRRRLAQRTSLTALALTAEVERSATTAQSTDAAAAAAALSAKYTSATD